MKNGAYFTIGIFAGGAAFFLFDAVSKKDVKMNEKKKNKEKTFINGEKNNKEKTSVNGETSRIEAEVVLHAMEIL